MTETETEAETETETETKTEKETKRCNSLFASNSFKISQTIRDGHLDTPSKLLKTVGVNKPFNFFVGNFVSLFIMKQRW